MKKILTINLLLILAFASCKSLHCKKNCKESCKKEENTADTSAVNKVPTLQEQRSYALGIFIGQDLKKNGFDSLDLESINLALEHVLNGDSLFQTSNESAQLLRSYQQEIQAKKQAATEKRKKENQDYLTKLAGKEGVQKTASGLMYKIITPGNSHKPTATEKVKVLYEGSLIDGSIFDGNMKSNKPISFGLNQVIKGWTEGLQLIGEGGEIELYIPFNLGYGIRPTPKIPAFSTLIFKVKLLEVVADTPAGAPQPHNHNGHDHHHGHDHKH